MNTRRHTDVLGNIRNVSAEANSCCNQVFIDHTYRDHCTDPVCVWPFLVQDGQEIFSDPPYFHVACNNQKGVGYKPDPDWFERMTEAHVSIIVIAKIKSYLERHPCCDCGDI